MDSMELYNKVRNVPTEAKKPISAGRLKGMTDINPMWRIQMLTEMFGTCGFGWYYKVIDKTVETVGDERCVFVDIELFVKMDDEWSQPIYGSGGAKLSTVERNGVYVSDECYKMATTDAISVACKQLGFGADVYWESGRSKYNSQPKEEPKKEEPKKEEPKKEEPKQEIPKSDPAVEEADFRAKVLGFVNRHQMSPENIQKICNRYKVTSLNEMTIQHCRHYIAQLEKQGGNINE